MKKPNHSAAQSNLGASRIGRAWLGALLVAATLATATASAETVNLKDLFGRKKALKAQQGQQVEQQRAAPATVAGRLFANMAEAGRSFNLDESQVEAAPLPIRGMFVLRARHDGSFVTYTNERGTLYGDSQSFQFHEPGRGSRSLTSSETAELRREMMASLDPSWFIPVSYGDGGGRQILLTSAVDCPACRSFETKLAASANEVDTTFLVFPASLIGPDSAEGMHNWETASRLLCSADSAKAWKTYWKTRATPAASPSCAKTPAVLHAGRIGLWDVMRAVGIRLTGYPAFVDEAGQDVRAWRTAMNPTQLQKGFGPAARPSVGTASLRWLR